MRQSQISKIKFRGKFIFQRTMKF